MADELNLRTPREFEPTLQWLAQAPEDAFAAGVGVLAEPIYERIRLYESLAKCEGWTRDHAAGVLRVLESLTDVQRLFDVAPGVIARSVAAESAEEWQQALASRLEQLLATPVVQMISRGRELAGEREHVLDDARILTDIRPLFTKGKTDQLDGAIITHSLRLTYTGSADPTIHIALDKAHLHLLQELIRRALDKATQLEVEIHKMGVPYVEPGGNIDASSQADGAK